MLFKSSFVISFATPLADMATNWTQTHPTEAGWYWWKPTPDWKPSPQEVWLHESGKIYMWGVPVRDATKGYWGDRIPNPD